MQRLNWIPCACVRVCVRVCVCVCVCSDRYIFILKYLNVFPPNKDFLFHNSNTVIIRFKKLTQIQHDLIYIPYSEFARFFLLPGKVPQSSLLFRDLDTVEEYRTLTLVTLSLWVCLLLLVIICRLYILTQKHHLVLPSDSYLEVPDACFSLLVILIFITRLRWYLSDFYCFPASFAVRYVSCY